MCLEERTRAVEPKYSNFFWKLSKAKGKSFTKERWEKFERLEVVNSPINWFERESAEAYLGDKLVWTNSD